MLRTSHSAPTATKPRLLFFYSPQEGASRRCDGYLAQVLQRRRNHNTFVVQRVDVSQRADIGERFRITETPSIMVIADGKVRARLTRPSSSAAIREQLKPWLR